MTRSSWSWPTPTRYLTTASPPAAVPLRSTCPRCGRLRPLPVNCSRDWPRSPGKPRSAELEIENGTIRNAASGQSMAYRDLAKSANARSSLEAPVQPDVNLTPVGDWKVMGQPVSRPNIRDLVTGNHRYPSDIVRPGMLYGAVLRPPSFGAELKSVDLSPAKSMEKVVAVQDGCLCRMCRPGILPCRAGGGSCGEDGPVGRECAGRIPSDHSYLPD